MYPRTAMLSPRFRTALIVSSVVVIVALTDAATKAWAEQALRLNEPLRVLGDFVRLRLGYNTGTAFGLFVDSGPIVPVLTGLVTVGIAAWLIAAVRRREPLTAQLLAIALVLGGAIGNVVDRLPDGRVTDFLDIGVDSLRWPSFNIADASIVVGVLSLVVLGGLRGGTSDA